MMMKQLISLGRFVFPKPTIIFTDRVPVNEPVVFVANHEKNYGPSVLQLHFPLKYRPWIIYHMLEAGECRQYIQETFFEERLGWPVWFSSLAAKVLEPLLIRLMHTTHPVPVYREHPQRIVETFRASLYALAQGDNLLIFPENPHEPLFSQEVRGFFEGFLYLAKLYARNTGKGLLFCPLSINPAKQTVTVGKLVRFNPTAEYKSEAERVRQHLMRQVAALYHQPWSNFPGGLSQEVSPEFQLNYQV